MLQVKFVKKPQKHILSFSKVLCAPSGEWLLPLHIFSLVTKKQFKFSNTTLRWNFPQTFCVLNQQPFLLFVKILCTLSTDTYSTSSKPGRSNRRLTSTLGQADCRGQRKRKQRNFFVPAFPKGIIAFSPNHVYVQIRQKNPVIWSFGLLYFTCLPSPSLLACKTRGHKKELILYEELCWTKQYDWEGVFVEREW